MSKETLEKGVCCGGNEIVEGYCLRNACALYRTLGEYIDGAYPAGTPIHSIKLAKIRSMILNAKPEGETFKW